VGSSTSTTRATRDLPAPPARWRDHRHGHDGGALWGDARGHPDELRVDLVFPADEGSDAWFREAARA
jgi:hypothetical protein